MEKYLIFAGMKENSDCIFVTEPNQETDYFFQKPEEKVMFQNEKIIKILSLSKNLAFSSFYIFVLTKSNDKNNYFLNLLNDNFEITRIHINNSTFYLKNSKSPFEFRIIDFTVCEKPQSANFIPIVFIAKYLFKFKKENQTQNRITYAAFFSSLNENEVMINNSLASFVWNDKAREPIFFVQSKNYESTPKSKQILNERPTLIQFAPPYFIYFRNRMFNVINIKKDHYQSFVLNDQPLHTAFCQFIRQDAALFVFNEIISIIDFSKQLNLPIHIFPYGKLRPNSKFFCDNNILYIFSDRNIYKVPILSSQLSDFSNIIEIQNDQFDRNPNCFTISCNNYILRFGDKFRIAKPKKAGTFAATMLIQNRNLLDCIVSLDSQPTKEARSQAYNDCFCELWSQEHKEEALMVACNRHFDLTITNVVSLFEIFNEPSDNNCLSDLKNIEATNIKKEEEFEIYKRLKFYLDQCRQRFKEKGIEDQLKLANSYIIMYLSYFHQQKELSDFLKEEDLSETKDKVKAFYEKFSEECSLGIEQALFYSGIHENNTALEMLKKLCESNSNANMDNSYHFSPRLEAVKIIKQPKFDNTKEKVDLSWIFSSMEQEPEIVFNYFLPNEEDYESEALNDSLHNMKAKEEKISFLKTYNFENWYCRFYIEWLRCKGLSITSRENYSISLFKKLKEVQENIVNNQSIAQKFLNKKKDEILWLDSIKKYFNKNQKVKRASTPGRNTSEFNASSALEESIKEIQGIIEETIVTMKKYPESFEQFKSNKDVENLIDIQDIDFKKSMKWLIEDYKEAIELESEGTTSESQIIKKCKQAINPAKAFKCFDENHKDVLERKSGVDKYEWEEKIEFIGLSEFINNLFDSTPLKTASPFLSTAISLMTSRIHNLEQRAQIQKQVIIEEKMKAAYDQVYEKVENISKKLLNSD